jgi:Fe-S oxidoreductase
MQLKKQVMMIDVFISKEIASGRIKSRLKLVGGDISIHGHCHQKALYGTTTMKSTLNLNENAVNEIPSGCCGMAGSFGYEKEHYDLSEKIGEGILFPKVRNLKHGTTLVANGFSCRHQIEHFTGVKPKHWVEVVRVDS